MSAPHANGEHASEDRLREQGLHAISRFVATLRTGRSYPIGNQVFTRQLEQFLESLQPLFAEQGNVTIATWDGDVLVNGMRMPLRPASLKLLEQMAAEFAVREIAGVELRPGLGFTELEGFMRFFLPSELYKGSELCHACAAKGFRHALPVEALEPEQEAPAAETVAAPADGPDRAPALGAWERAAHNAHLLLGDGSWRRGLELRHLKRVAQPLVDTHEPGVPATTALAFAGRDGEGHALRVCLLAIAVGRELGLSRAALAELGVAALLHDAGQAAVATRVHGRPEVRDADSRAAEQRHVLEGLRAIALSTTLNPATLLAMRVAFEHHTFGPTPYPANHTGHEPSVAAGVVAIADAFVTQLEHPTADGGWATPGEALGRVLGPLSAGFPAGLRAALVRALGVHPPGEIVRLDDGSLARSLGAYGDAPERPLLEWLHDDGLPDGRVEDLPADRRVERALPYAEWPAALRAA